MQASTLQIGIARPWLQVCEFLAQPRHFAQWASWLGPSLRLDRGEWTVLRPHGRRAKVRFCERNAYGVADHWRLDDEDQAVFVALRAVPNGEGTEVLLTCFREPGSSADEWADQQDRLQRDLVRLRALLCRAQGYEERVSAGGEGAALARA